MKVIIVVLFGILVMDLCTLWLQSATTSVVVVPEVKTIGTETPIASIHREQSRRGGFAGIAGSRPEAHEKQLKALI